MNPQPTCAHATSPRLGVPAAAMAATALGAWNFRLFAAAAAVLAVGYGALAQGPWHGSLSLSWAPLLLVLGYCVLVPVAILHPPAARPSLRRMAHGVAGFAPRAIGREPAPLLGLLTALASFAVYRATLAPTFTLWDSGELIAAAHVLGITHPPGAPLFVLLGRIAAMLPAIDEPSARVNLMSAAFGAATAGVVFLIVARLVRAACPAAGRAVISTAGAVGALALAFSDAHWANAQEAELYAPSLFGTALVLWLVLRWAQERKDAADDRWLLLAAYLTGLALGMHVLHALALPACFLVGIGRRRDLPWPKAAGLFGLGLLATGAVYPGIVKWVPLLLLRLSAVGLALLVLAPAALAVAAWRARRHVAWMVAASLLLVLLGFSTYAVSYVRSTLDPPIDQNDPQTTQQLHSYLEREQYGRWGMFPRRAPLWDFQVKRMYLRYLGWQFAGKDERRGPDGGSSRTFSLHGLLGLPLLLGLIGLVVQLRRDPRAAAWVLLLFLLMGLAIVFYVNQEDPQQRERDYVYVGSFLAFALWIGVGAGWVTERVQALAARGRGSAWLTGGAIALLLLAVPLRMLALNLPARDRSDDRFAYEFAQNLLATLPRDAILLSRGDNDTYPVWCLQTVYGARPDVQVVNLQMLNMAWYVKQLAHRPPGLPLNWTDAQIDMLEPVGWAPRAMGFPVADEVLRDLPHTLQLPDSLRAAVAGGLRVQLSPSDPSGGLRVRDQVLAQVLGVNAFRRPVYLGPSTPEELANFGLDPFLREEGLASRLLPVAGGWRLLDADLLRANLEQRYRYESLRSSAVGHDVEVLGLIQKLRSSFLTLAECEIVARRPPQALAALDAMEARIPERRFPLRVAALDLRIGRVRYAAGDTPGLQHRLRTILSDYALAPQEKLNLAMLMLFPCGREDVADSLAAAVRSQLPPQRWDVPQLVAVHQQLLGDARGAGRVEGWLQRQVGGAQ